LEKKLTNGLTGTIKTWKTSRAFGWIENDRSGVSVWFCREDFAESPLLIRVDSRVSFDLIDYKSKSGPRTKAVNVKTLPPLEIKPPECRPDEDGKVISRYPTPSPAAMSVLVTTEQ
jgi:cold shock CspA family protein